LSEVVPLEPKKLESPPYEAVTVSSAMGALAAVHMPAPALSVAVHSVTEPLDVVNVTDPGGIPPGEVTVVE